MATLMLGDMHLKQPYVLPRLLRYVRDPDLGVDRLVFLGDACDEWGATEHDALRALGYCADWVQARRDEGLRVDVLLGNHDMCYIRGKVGAGTIAGIIPEVRACLEERLGVQMACTVGRCLCCHAGLTQDWADEHLAGVPADPVELAAALNAMLGDSSQWAALDSAGPSRGGWSLPGPLWADASDLAYGALAGVDQVVGHTPVARVGRLGMVGWERDEAPQVWVCDTMSLFRSGAPIGDGSVLLVDDEGRPRALPFPDEAGYAAVAAAMASQRQA